MIKHTVMGLSAMVNNQLLLVVILYCVIAVAAARLIDFIVGKRGGKWMKEHLLFRPWIKLSKYNTLLSLLQTTSSLFSVVISKIFGSRLFSFRAYMLSSIIGYIIGPLLFFYLILIIEVNHQPIAHLTTGYRDEIAWFVALGLINPLFDLLSFSITRGLARKIASSTSIFLPLTLWCVDFIAAILIMLVTYACISSFVGSIAPDYSVSLWFGIYETYDIALFAALTGLVPTVLHIVFAAMFLALLIAEGVRRILLLFLERMDESGERPLTIVISFFGTIVVVLSAIFRIIN